jgi:hypothetical protein
MHAAYSEQNTISAAAWPQGGAYCSLPFCLQWAFGGYLHATWVSCTGHCATAVAGLVAGCVQFCGCLNLLWANRAHMTLNVAAHQQFCYRCCPALAARWCWGMPWAVAKLHTKVAFCCPTKCQTNCLHHGWALFGTICLGQKCYSFVLLDFHIV